jgi:hypothetical protein
MRIAQVISSNLPILPTGQRGWGATELIMDEYTKNLRKLGHEVDLLYLNDVDPKKYNIVHIHVANLCLEAHKRAIEYAILSPHPKPITIVETPYGKELLLTNFPISRISSRRHSLVSCRLLPHLFRASL